MWRERFEREWAREETERLGKGATADEGTQRCTCGHRQLKRWRKSGPKLQKRLDDAW